MKKLLLTFTLLVAVIVQIRADELSFTADAPNAVVMGETFR